MKFTAAALLALSVAAVQLKEIPADLTEVTEANDPNGPPPECGPVPEIPDDFTDADMFLLIAGEDLHIDEFEAKRALYCAAKWDLISMEEAMLAFEEGMIAAGGDRKLSMEDAGLSLPPPTDMGTY